MTLDFSWLPPEINSARIFTGAGSGPLFMAASAWDGLAADLRASASSFDSVISGLTGGPWAGPASATMAATAVPYVGWLSAAAGQAELSAGQARAAATAFEAALTATVHPATVAANRVSLVSLVATDFFGLNAPAIAATEFDYVEMWAQDVAAMVGYHAGAASVASAITPFSVPPVNLAGLAGVASMGSAVATQAQGLLAAAPAALTAVQSAASSGSLQSVLSVARIGMYPASMMMSPLMMLANSARAGTSGLGAAAATGLVDAPKFVGDTAPAMKGLGGGGLGSAMSAGLGKARMVGAMSVPANWHGSAPVGIGSSAMHGLGGAGMPNPAEMAQAAGAGAGGRMGMMPMPMGMGGAGGGMPGGMMGRGGASPNMTQSRPSVVPRTGV